MSDKSAGSLHVCLSPVKGNTFGPVSTRTQPFLSTIESGYVSGATSSVRVSTALTMSFSSLTKLSQSITLTYCPVKFSTSKLFAGKLHPSDAVPTQRMRSWVADNAWRSFNLCEGIIVAFSTQATVKVSG